MPVANSAARAGRAHPVVLVFVLLVAVAAAIWIWWRPAEQPSMDAGRSIAEEFLSRLRHGQPGDAWASTTAEFKSAQGQEAFVREVRPLKFLREPMDFVSVQTVEVARQPRSEYLFRAPTGETVRIVLGSEDGRWKVDRWMR